MMAQSLCHVKEVYKVPATIFVPKPKVDASVVQLRPKPFFTDAKDMLGTYIALENILRFYFTKRRKTMGHITKRLGKEMETFTPLLVEQVESMIDFKARPEDIPTEQFCDLAKLLYKHDIVKLPLI